MTASSSTTPFALSVRVFPARDEPPSAEEAAIRGLHRGAKRTRKGRPCVDGLGSFGVSHAGSHTAYLLANRRHVGIDLELRDRPGLDGLERRLATAVAGADAIQVGFLTRWVLKEASLKALGLPLVPTLRRVRLLAETAGRGDGMRAFELTVGPIAMRAVTCDFGPGLIALAYRASYGTPEMDVVTAPGPAPRLGAGASAPLRHGP